ncbi:MAG: hypothetical protein K8S24_06530 [Candidatus Aegiribacteria sp.]|nr:hypothetical protein [Candidatus Aegiribacteria sp.]
MEILSANKKQSLSGFSFFIGGLLSILVQAVVLRESLFGCHQAELASGIVLAAWIVGSGLGAAVGGRASRHRLYWMTGIVILPFLGLLQVIASRTGILPLAITVLPAGFVAGIVFIQPYAFDRPGRIYAFEAMGAAVGGGIFVLLSPYLLACEMLAVSILFSIIGLLSCRSIVTGLMLAVILLALQLFSIPEGLSRRIGVVAFSNYENAQVYPSPYGEVVTASRTGQHVVWRSGLLSATWPSLESAEETVTVPLVASLPSTVLYIGSSPEEAGIINSWPTVDRCVTVVPERTLAEVIEYPGEIRVGDGRHYLADDVFLYDLIIVSAGQPLTLLSNRFYTAEFMKLLAGRLTPEGIAAVHLPGGINRLHPLEAKLAHSVMLASEGCFQWNRIIPISGLMLMAGNGPEPSFEGGVLAERMDSLGVAGVYVNSGTLPYDLSEFRTAVFDDQIASADAETNRDLHPEGFRIAHELWDFRMDEGGKTDLTIPAVGLFVLIMVAAAVLSGKPLTSLGVAAAGFTGLSVEVISLVSIQAATGYSWVLVGAVTGIFMTGGALGAFWTDKGIFKSPARIIALSGIAALFCAVTLHLYSIGFCGGFFLTLCLLLGTFMCGVSSGGIFPSAVIVLGHGSTGKIGLLDLAEHGGSAAASLLMPLVLFPLLGAVKALLIATAWVAIWTVVLRHR